MKINSNIVYLAKTIMIRILTLFCHITFYIMLHSKIRQFALCIIKDMKVNNVILCILLKTSL